MSDVIPKLTLLPESVLTERAIAAMRLHGCEVRVMIGPTNPTYNLWVDGSFDSWHLTDESLADRVHDLVKAWLA